VTVFEPRPSSVTTISATFRPDALAESKRLVTEWVSTTAVGGTFEFSTVIDSAFSNLLPAESVTRTRIDAQGLRVATLRTVWDVDVEADLNRWDAEPSAN
jgi:hypothetical protein